MEPESTQQTGAARSAVSCKPWLGCWTKIAIEAGAMLSLKREGWNYEAAMIWPGADKEPISSAASDPLQALAELEDALCEDAAGEMLRSGAA